jgi:hypothetical protein
MAIMAGWALPNFNVQVNGIKQQFDIEPVGISFEANSDTVKSKKYVGGRRVTAGSIEVGTEYMLKVVIEAVTWQALQLALGQLATKETFILPERKLKVVQAGEIVDADIVSNNIIACTTKKGPWGRARSLTRVTSATPAIGEFAVDVATTKLILNPAYNNAPVLYSLDKNYANWDTIGHTATPVALNTIGFSGIVFGDEETEKYKFNCPVATRDGTPSFDPNDVTSLEINYTMVATTENPVPFTLTPIAA